MQLGTTVVSQLVDQVCRSRDVVADPRLSTTALIQSESVTAEHLSGSRTQSGQKLGASSGGLPSVVARPATPGRPDGDVRQTDARAPRVTGRQLPQSYINSRRSFAVAVGGPKVRSSWPRQGGVQEFRRRLSGQGAHR